MQSDVWCPSCSDTDTLWQDSDEYCRVLYLSKTVPATRPDLQDRTPIQLSPASADDPLRVPGGPREGRRRRNCLWRSQEVSVSRCGSRLRYTQLCRSFSGKWPPGLTWRLLRGSSNLSRLNFNHWSNRLVLLYRNCAPFNYNCYKLVTSEATNTQDTLKYIRTPKITTDARSLVIKSCDNLSRTTRSRGAS